MFIGIIVHIPAWAGSSNYDRTPYVNILLPLVQSVSSLTLILVYYLGKLSFEHILWRSKIKYLFSYLSPI